MTERYVHTVWCDDIRQEIGNKPSFMGVYTAGIVLGQLPTVLPRLGVFTWLSTAIDKPFKKFTLRVVRDDGHVLVEMTPESIDTGASALCDATRKVFMAGLTLGPVEIPAGCKFFKVTVEEGSEVIEGPKLRVEINGDFLATFNAGSVAAQGPLPPPT